MKHISRSFFILFISALVLLGSGGFTIGKMICGGNECGDADYSLGIAKDCCDNASSASIDQSCCCELINVSYTLDDFNSSEKTTVSPQQIDSAYLASGIFNLSFELFSSKNIFSVSDLPPPDTKELFFLFCSLLL